ncbi:hypothetical protein DY000_02047542 [Brassica cretica]|uniref:Alpha/beta hydrolase n=1 Tax=Brassica cretica TaxID=69181 RepID=A0ABQ7FB87_BRACR|nr:hypothetical protein DY000_02047542 [Brassica cretica]
MERDGNQVTVLTGFSSGVAACRWALVPAHDGTLCVMWLAFGFGVLRSSRHSFRLLAPVNTFRFGEASALGSIDADDGFQFRWR